MSKYKIEITETLQKVVEVEADSEREAEQKVKAMYKNEGIVLDYNDFVNLDFKNVLI